MRDARDMQALRIDHYGPPSQLSAADVPPPSLGAGDVRISIEAAGVNPSDIVSAEGRFPNAPLPRILGRDYAGRVSGGTPELEGAEVWGSGGDLGILRDGTHAELLVVPRDAISVRPHNLSADEAAAVGVPFVTAWSALVDDAGVREGEWVLVAGAAGAVGHAAVELARARGARVVALVRDAEEGARLDRDRVAAIARSDAGDVADVVREATRGRGCDVALNGVGGAVFQPMLDALADGGRMVVYSAAAGRQVPLDLFLFYRRRLRLIGENTIVLNATDCARILTSLTPLFESGTLRPPSIAGRYPLSRAAEAYERVAAGAPGKIVLVPDH